MSFAGSPGLRFSSGMAATGSNGEASVTATATTVGSLTATASVSDVTGSATFSLAATKATLTVTANNLIVAYKPADSTKPGLRGGSSAESHR